jgi:hypothetical protein
MPPHNPAAGGHQTERLATVPHLRGSLALPGPSPNETRQGRHKESSAAAKGDR